MGWHIFHKVVAAHLFDHVETAIIKFLVDVLIVNSRTGDGRNGGSLNDRDIQVHNWETKII